MEPDEWHRHVTAVAASDEHLAAELAEGGTTVLVPQADVYQLRLDLSAAGLPEGGEAGYELLDQQGITTSEFRQRVDYQRALEGEADFFALDPDPLPGSTALAALGSPSGD